MPKFEINLSDELVEGIEEMILRENFPVDRKNIPGFIEWMMKSNVESRKKDKQMQRLAGMSGSQLKEALDEYEKKPKTK